LIKLTNQSSKKNFTSINLGYEISTNQSIISHSLSKRQQRPLSSVRNQREQSSISTRATVRSKKAYPDGEMQIEYWKLMNENKDKFIGDIAVSN